MFASGLSELGRTDFQGKFVCKDMFKKLGNITEQITDTIGEPVFDTTLSSVDK